MASQKYRSLSAFIATIGTEWLFLGIESWWEDLPKMYLSH